MSVTCGLESTPILERRVSEAGIAGQGLSQSHLQRPWSSSGPVAHPELPERSRADAGGSRDANRGRAEVVPESPTVQKLRAAVSGSPPALRSLGPQNREAAAGPESSVRAGAAALQEGQVALLELNGRRVRLRRNGGRLQLGFSAKNRTYWARISEASFSGSLSEARFLGRCEPGPKVEPLGHLSAEEIGAITGFVERQLIPNSPYNVVMARLAGARSKTEVLAELDAIEQWKAAALNGELPPGYPELRHVARVPWRGGEITSRRRLGWLQQAIDDIRGAVRQAPDGQLDAVLAQRAPEGAWAVAKHLEQTHGIRTVAELEAVGFPARVLEHFDEQGNFDYRPSRPAALDVMAPTDPHDVFVVTAPRADCETVHAFIAELPSDKKVIIATGEGSAFEDAKEFNRLRAIKGIQAASLDAGQGKRLRIFDGAAGGSVAEFLAHDEPGQLAVYLDRRPRAHHRYSRDYGIGLRGGADGRASVLVPHHFGDDGRLDWAAMDMLEADGLIDVHRTDLLFEGGNILVDDKHAFVGRDTVRTNVEKLGLSEAQVIEAFEKELGRPVIVMPQQDYHVDVFMVPLGARELDGEVKPTVLWRQDPSNERTHEVGRAGIALLESHGYRVVAVDGSASRTVANAVLDGSTLYVADDVSPETKQLLRKLGFSVVVELPDTRTDGGIHCMTLP